MTIDLDRRVQKTRQLLQEALTELISEKGFEAVTIQEILDRANVGRSTFYNHFENKFELLHSCFEELHHLFEQHNARISECKNHPGNLSETEFTLNLFLFAARNHRLFKAILGNEGIAMFNHPIYDYVFAYMNEALRMLIQNKKPAFPQPDMLTHYVVSAFIGTLKWWVNNDLPCTPEEVNQHFQQFVMYGIKDVLKQ